ncbi:sigma 54-interacting transcriptional regulator [candidate division KSB1 bacterium]
MESTEWIKRLSHFTIENATDAIFWIDANANILHVNQSACDRYGYSREEFLSLTIHDINPEYKKKSWKDTWDNIRKKKNYFFESNHKTKQGKIIPVEILTNYIKLDGKEFSCSFARDVTFRKDIEKKLLDKNKLLTNTIDSLTHPFYVIDVKNYEVIMHNQAAIESDHQEPIKCYTLSHKRDEPCDGKDHPCTIHEVINKGESITVEHIHHDKDDKPTYFEIHAYPVFDENNKISHIIEYSIDITRRKQAEEQLIRALEEVKQLKDRLEEENIYLQHEIKLDHNFEEIISSSEIFNKLLGQVEQVAATDATVLILGETGTGKELLARAIHNISERSKRPLVKVNCSALPATLIESELFGHEKGAFTGALNRKIGRFELADGGTIFLDEIGDLPLELQTKLLRVIQEGEFDRLGGSETLKVDVRVIAATNVELEVAINEGKFRSDLYYRLNVFPILVPPLRERKEDIPLLVRHFLIKYGNKIGKKIDVVPQKVMTTLVNYNWPGNVRELENVIERAIILNKGKKLEPGDWLPKNTAVSMSSMVLSLEELEKNHIIEVLEMTGWRISGDKGAANILKIKPTTLEARMKKLGIYRKK